MEIRWIEKILLVTQIIKLTIITTVLSENNLNNRQQLLKNNKIETKLLLENHNNNNDNLIETNYNLNKFIKNQNNEKYFSNNNNNIKNTNYNNNNNNNNNNENENNININDDNSKKSNINENQPHSRKKRLIWVTDDGRLALPPGTQLSISPTVSLPLVRYPPNGFLSNISFNFPITMDLDKLGLTDNQNPLGDIPFFSARTFGRAAGTMLGNYISSYLNYRSKRDLTSSGEKFSSKMNDENFKINSILEGDNNDNGNSLPLPPELPDDYKHAFHGGERVLLYGVIEDLLSTFGLNGTACLLRAICEIHSRSIHSYGFFGETVKLLLTPTKSPFAEFLTEHVKAQRIGEGKLSPGECFPYYKDCSQGLFKVRQSYREDFNLRKSNENENFNDNNDIDNDDIIVDDGQTKNDKSINRNKKLFDNLSM